MAIIDPIQQEESNLPIMLSAKDSFSEASGKNEYWYIFLPVDDWKHLFKNLPWFFTLQIVTICLDISPFILLLKVLPTDISSSELSYIAPVLRQNHKNSP